ncbi:OmpA family protein [Methyloradius palustris]|uniref:Membrane protein n=1 Tax=Methyloradius palustris TaxID=2778876 RepID=A0A8D5G8T1_9PROT|nr:OmpA family protein [Methyloradius palustris]BCM25221.1 membrane protein [Methyloradius palustris]
MNKNLISLAVAGVLAVAAFNASADEAYEGSWYALPGISAMHADNDLSTEDWGPGVSLKFGKELSEHWDVQIGASFARVDAEAAGVSGKYKQTLVGVDALYLFSREKFRPFVVAGLGLAQNDVDYSGAGYSGQNKTSWAANVGLGAQYLITDTFGLQADVRYVWSKADASPAFTDETIGNTYLNFGAIFKFGAPKQVAAAEPMPEPTPAAAVAEEAAPVGPAEPAFEKVTLSAEVLFGFDKDVLKEDGKKILDSDVVEKMKAHPEVELVLITGHTDKIGDAGYNQKLSERRANSVKKYLVSQGIEESRLHAVGKGEAEPAVEVKGLRGKKLIEALQPNRRVVVEIEVQRAE